MRAATTLLIRMLCSLALMVAAMPVRAGAPLCVPTAKPAAMACCKAMKPMASMACCKAKQTASKYRLASRSKASCGCAVKSGPAAPRSTERAVTSAFELPVIGALLPSGLAIVDLGDVHFEPGVFGVDSGPPPNDGHVSDLGRAPPAFRA